MLARLRFKDSMTLPQEMMLVHKFGFAVIERNKTENWIEFGKSLKPTKTPNTDDLDEDIKNELIRKVNHIVDHYRDPENHVKSIRVRLNNLAQCHTELIERKFIQQWADKYVVEDQ